MASIDKAALLALYHATRGPEWENKWDTETDIWRWHGVRVNEGRVVELDLGGNNLQGTIPAEMGRLTTLQVLGLQNNQLSGHIPKELGALGKLQELWLNNNQLSGHIPWQLGKLGFLVTLRLQQNKLKGTIPPELGRFPALKELYLGGNKLSGSIPKQLGELSSLVTLSLWFNKLTGPIPAELGILSAVNQLDHLDLSGNQLNGAIPPLKLERCLLDGNLLSDIKPMAFFSHTETSFSASTSPASHLVSVVRGRLVERGKLEVFYDAVNLKSAVGKPLESVIFGKVNESTVFVAILTPAFSQRFWCLYELDVALRTGRQIVPVLFETTFDHLLSNVGDINNGSICEDETEEGVINTSVNNLKTLSKLRAIIWMFNCVNKTTVEKFGDEVAESVEEVAERWSL